MTYELIHYKISLLSPLFYYTRTEGDVGSTEPFIGDLALFYALNHAFCINNDIIYSIRDKPDYSEITKLGYFWTVGKPLSYEKTPVYVRKTSEVSDGMVRKDLIEKMGKRLFKNYFRVQGIQAGSEFEASLLNWDNSIAIPKKFSLRIGNSRECLIAFERKKEEPKEIWLNAYTLKLFNKKLKLKTDMSMNYLLNQYILLKNYTINDLTDIFNLK